MLFYEFLGNEEKIIDWLQTTNTERELPSLRQRGLKFMLKRNKCLIFTLLAAVFPFAIASCSSSGEGVSYEQIGGAEAKAIMDSESGYIILDVREQDEYDEGHIPGAILIPYGEIADRAEKELADKDQLILVYCRSGRRSKIAAEALVKLGYTNVKEFGGIIDWEYEIVK